MKTITVLLFLCTSLSSCLLFGTHKKSSFSYTRGNETVTVPVLVPKGYTSSIRHTDSAGNTSVVYQYGKAFFYITHVADTALFTHIIRYEANIPRQDSAGTLVYKGLSEEGLYWREIYRPHLRAGYRYVPRGREGRFDEATNFVLLHTMKAAAQ